MKTDNWKGGDHGGAKRFGNKARQWFARRLRAKLAGVDRMTGDELDSVVDRFLQDPGLYVKWEDEDRFYGSRFASGAWVIDWQRVERDQHGLLARIRLEQATSMIATLDDWLRADMDDSLEYRFTGGSATFSKDLRSRIEQAARARRRTWPLLCVDCRRTFRPRPNSRGKPIRCAGCLEIKKGNDRPVT